MTYLSVVEKRAPGRPRSRESHEAILDATLALLAEVGFAAMTIDEVAARSGTGKATIYRRWSSKVHLTLAAFEKLPEIPRVDSGTIDKDLETIVRRFIRLMETTPLGKVFPSLVGAAANNRELLAKIRPVLDGRRDPAREAVSRAIGRGELVKGTDVDVLIDYVMGPVLMHLFLDGEAPSGAYIKKTIANALAPYRAG